jgi:hypothetical protein
MSSPKNSFADSFSWSQKIFGCAIVRTYTMMSAARLLTPRLPKISIPAIMAVQTRSMGGHAQSFVSIPIVIFVDCIAERQKIRRPHLHRS